MNIWSLFLAVKAPFFVAIPLALTACDAHQSQVDRANSEYQLAIATNDLFSKRLALRKLAALDEDVSQYWIDLGNTDLEIGDYSAAYESFSRAHELRRADVAPLSLMTELAVITGRSDLAARHSKELSVIAPDDRAVFIVTGFNALRVSNYSAAEASADALLARVPHDSIAILLKARALVAQKRIPEAIALLDDQLSFRSDDRAALRSLAAIHRHAGAWREAARVNLRLMQLNPADIPRATLTVEAAIRADDLRLSRAITTRVLQHGRNPRSAEAILSLWAQHRPRTLPTEGFDPQAIASDQARVEYALYLNRVGREKDAAALVGTRPRQPVTGDNVRFNAAVAATHAMHGQLKVARSMFDRVLAAEPDERAALGGRAILLSRLGHHRRAIIDGQRLVTAYPTDANHRLLLARIYRASSDGQTAERTLWDAFRDLPGDEMLYDELHRCLGDKGDFAGQARLKERYDNRRSSMLLKEIA